MTKHKIGDLIYSGKHLGIIKKVPPPESDDLIYTVEWCYETVDAPNLQLSSKYGPLTIEHMKNQLGSYKKKMNDI